MSNSFWVCEEAAGIGAKLIREVETHHHLGEAKIAYLFQDKPTKRDGKVRVGCAYVCSPRDRALHGHDLMVVLDSDTWRDQLLPEQRLAWLDHELCHFQRATTAKKLSRKASRAFDKANIDRYLSHDEDPDGRIVVTLTAIAPDGRPLFRKRHHDVEGFAEVIERRGLFHQDLREAVKLFQKWLPGLEPAASATPKTKGNGHKGKSAGKPAIAGAVA